MNFNREYMKKYRKPSKSFTTISAQIFSGKTSILKNLKTSRENGIMFTKPILQCIHFPDSLYKLQNHSISSKDMLQNTDEASKLCQSKDNIVEYICRYFDVCYLLFLFAATVLARFLGLFHPANPAVHDY